MNWFQHDADSTQDAKIKKLLIRHGAIGYAVYFHCLELIIGDVCETNITFELEHDSEIIADNLKITGTGNKSGREMVEDIMRTIVELGLFTNENGHIFCYKLLKRINMSMTSNKGLRDAITQAKDENHDTIMTRHDKVMLPTNLPTNLPTKPTIPKEETPEKPARAQFVKPTLSDVSLYCKERGNRVDPQKWLDYYTSNGWKVGKNPMKNWKAAVRTWENNGYNQSNGYSKPKRDLSNGYQLPDGMDEMPGGFK